MVRRWCGSGKWPTCVAAVGAGVVQLSRVVFVSAARCSASSMSSVDKAKSSGTCTPLLGSRPSPLIVVEPGAPPRLSSFVPDVELLALVPPVLGLFSTSLASSPSGLSTVLILFSLSVPDATCYRRRETTLCLMILGPL